MIRGHTVREVFTENNFSFITTLNDLAGLERVTMGQYSQ